MSSQAYLFAHRAVPKEAFSDPARFLSIINGPDAGRYMADIWNHVAQFCEPAAVRPDEVPRAEIRGEGNGLSVIIFMPPPREMTEAHFVGAFSRFADADNPSLDDLAWFRLFTLEHSIDPTTNAQLTMLCEWTPDGTHLNHGAGPPPVEQAFVEAVHDQIGGERGVN